MIFTHVSRTGGTTITNLLRSSLPDCQQLVGQHAPLVSARPVLGELFAQSFKFAFVRNPWERLLSWYAVMGLKSEAGVTAASVADPESKHWKGFDAFLENWSAKKMVIDGVERRELSQWAQLTDRDGVLLTDDIGRIESFAADADRLLAKAGIQCASIPRLNPSRHYHYSVYYSAFGRELVEERFHEDVVHLGYRFDDAVSHHLRTDNAVDSDQTCDASGDCVEVVRHREMKMESIPLAEPAETGTLGVLQLKRLWSRLMRQRRGLPADAGNEGHLEHVVLDAVGVGLEQTMQHVFQTGPSFEEFERWIISTTGGVAATQVARINAMVMGAEPPDETQAWLAEVEAGEPVLSAEDLAFWDEHGYVIVHDAVPVAGREAATQAILDHVGARLDDPDSWYKPNDHGIMVQFFQHPAFTANRQSRRIHKAFAQLWQTADLWVSTDRAGFNVPERPGWMFRGPHLHWDVSLARPIPFGTQGILYLTDTEAEQGAFTLVPGFQHRINAWLDQLPPGADPRQENLHALGSKPIAGRAGDLIIWHHALPHGSRPNRATQPRIVQYINMRPARMQVREEWI